MRKILFQNDDYTIIYDFEHSSFIINVLSKQENVSTKYFHKLVGYFRDIEKFTLSNTLEIINEITKSMYAVNKETK